MGRSVNSVPRTINCHTIGHQVATIGHYLWFLFPTNRPRILEPCSGVEPLCSSQNRIMSSETEFWRIQKKQSPLCLFSAAYQSIAIWMTNLSFHLRWSHAFFHCLFFSLGDFLFIILMLPRTANSISRLNTQLSIDFSEESVINLLVAQLKLIICLRMVFFSWIASDLCHFASSSFNIGPKH